jgi:hypothetical protein
MGSQKRTILCHWGWVVTITVFEKPSPATESCSRVSRVVASEE